MPLLTDTGPLVALCNRRDAHYGVISRSFGAMRDTMLTTSGCMTEAMHLLYRAGGWSAQNRLWNLVRGGVLAFGPEMLEAPLRIAEYMKRFRDQPCDYADATLLVAAEETGHRRVFTIDPHFHAYRLTDGSALEVVP